MSNRQITGIALLVVGAALLFMGYQASQSVGEQVIQSLTGRLTDSTTLYLVLGAIASVGGIVLLAARR